MVLEVLDGSTIGPLYGGPLGMEVGETKRIGVPHENLLFVYFESSSRRWSRRRQRRV